MNLFGLFFKFPYNEKQLTNIITQKQINVVGGAVSLFLLTFLFLYFTEFKFFYFTCKLFFIGLTYELDIFLYYNLYLLADFDMWFKSYSTVYYTPITNFSILFFTNTVNFFEFFFSKYFETVIDILSFVLWGGFFSKNSFFFFLEWRFLFLFFFLILLFSFFFNLFYKLVFFYVFNLSFIFSIIFVFFFKTNDFYLVFDYVNFQISESFKNRNLYVDSNYFLTSNTLFGLEKFSEVSVPWLVDYEDFGWGSDFDAQSQVKQIYERERRFILDELNINHSPHLENLEMGEGSLGSRLAKARGRLLYYVDVFSFFFNNFFKLSGIFRNKSVYSLESDYQNFSNVVSNFFRKNNYSIYTSFGTINHDQQPLWFSNLKKNKDFVRSFIPKMEIKNEFILPKKNNITNENFKKIGEISDRKQTVYRKLTDSLPTIDKNFNVKSRAPDTSKESNYVFERQLQAARSVDLDFKEFLKNRIIRRFDFYYPNSLVSEPRMEKIFDFEKKKTNGHSLDFYFNLTGKQSVSGTNYRYFDTRFDSYDINLENLLKYWSNRDFQHNFIEFRDTEFVYFKNTNRFVSGFFLQDSQVSEVLHNLLANNLLGIGMFTYQDYDSMLRLDDSSESNNFLEKFLNYKLDSAVSSWWGSKNKFFFYSQLREYVDLYFSSLGFEDKKCIMLGISLFGINIWFDFESRNIFPNTQDIFRLALSEFLCSHKYSSVQMSKIYDKINLSVNFNRKIPYGRRLVNYDLFESYKKSALSSFSYTNKIYKNSEIISIKNFFDNFENKHKRFNLNTSLPYFKLVMEKIWSSRINSFRTSRYFTISIFGDNILFFKKKKISLSNNSWLFTNLFNFKVPRIPTPIFYTSTKRVFILFEFQKKFINFFYLTVTGEFYLLCNIISTVHNFLSDKKYNYFFSTDHFYLRPFLLFFYIKKILFIIFKNSYADFELLLFLKKKIISYFNYCFFLNKLSLDFSSFFFYKNNTILVLLLNFKVCCVNSDILFNFYYIVTFLLTKVTYFSIFFESLVKVFYGCFENILVFIFRVTFSVFSNFGWFTNELIAFVFIFLSKTGYLAPLGVVEGLFFNSFLFFYFDFISVMYSFFNLNYKFFCLFFYFFTNYSLTFILFFDKLAYSLIYYFNAVLEITKNDINWKYHLFTELSQQFGNTNLRSLFGDFVKKNEELLPYVVSKKNNNKLVESFFYTFCNLTLILNHYYILNFFFKRDDNLCNCVSEFIFYSSQIAGSFYIFFENIFYFLNKSFWAYDLLSGCFFLFLNYSKYSSTLIYSFLSYFFFSAHYILSLALYFFLDTENLIGFIFLFFFKLFDVAINLNKEIHLENTGTGFSTEFGTSSVDSGVRVFFPQSDYVFFFHDFLKFDDNFTLSSYFFNDYTNTEFNETVLQSKYMFLKEFDYVVGSLKYFKLLRIGYQIILNLETLNNFVNLGYKKVERWSINSGSLLYTNDLKKKLYFYNSQNLSVRNSYFYCGNCWVYGLDRKIIHKFSDKFINFRIGCSGSGSIGNYYAMFGSFFFKNNVKRSSTLSDSFNFYNKNTYNQQVLSQYGIESKKVNKLSFETFSNMLLVFDNYFYKFSDSLFFNYVSFSGYSFSSWFFSTINNLNNLTFSTSFLNNEKFTIMYLPFVPQNTNYYLKKNNYFKLSSENTDYFKNRIYKSEKFCDEVTKISRLLKLKLLLPVIFLKLNVDVLLKFK